MRFCYSDQPYLSGAHLYKANHPRWEDYATIEAHAHLVDRCVRDYDAFAMSMGSVDMMQMIRETNLPPDTRWGAWVKSFASFKPNVNPAYAWEPVAFYGGRKLGRGVATVRDFIVCPITVQKGLTGAKPPQVCAWILDMLGWAPEDEIDDLFPGTGIMGRVIAERRARVNNEPLRLLP